LFKLLWKVSKRYWAVLSNSNRVLIMHTPWAFFTMEEGMPRQQRRLFKLKADAEDRRAEDMVFATSFLKYVLSFRKLPECLHYLL
jgi:hypothetical protein